MTGSTYAFMTFSAISDNVATGQGGCFQVNYSGQELNAGDILSTDNYLEGAHTTVTLSKDSSCKIYTEANIYIHTNTETTAPIDTVEAMRYKLVTEDNIEYNGFVKKSCDVLVATVPITDSSITYDIYVWVDSNLSGGVYHDTTYSGYIYAESSQTSTVENQDALPNSDKCQSSTRYVGFSYIGRAQEYTIPKTGTYKIEAWGASGNAEGNAISPGKGAYVSGNINLATNNILFFYIGGNNLISGTNYTYNGGGDGEAKAGGATDIRLTNGNWDNFNSLKSRIMVAGGGGGGFYKLNTTQHSPGHAGGLEGMNADAYHTNTSKFLLSDGYSGHGATQISGGLTGSKSTETSFINLWNNYNRTYNFDKADGSFGKGGVGSTNGRSVSSGGGSGYYGGGHGLHPGGTWSGGGGGSSFISGHSGCNAISESSTESNITHTGQSIHYSGLSFTETVMIDGGSSMPTHDGSSTMIGNSGNGYAKITYIE